MTPPGASWWGQWGEMADGRVHHNSETQRRFLKILKMQGGRTCGGDGLVIRRALRPRSKQAPNRDRMKVERKRTQGTRKVLLAKERNEAHEEAQNNKQ